MLKKIAKEIKGCTKCGLCMGKNLTVPGVFPEDAEILLVGEAPGAEEDSSGLPFVGKAGQKLDEILRSLGIHRDKLAVANILKCRPPDNRAPHKEETEACINYLYRQIHALKPKLIVAMGRVAASALLGQEVKVGAMNGKAFMYQLEEGEYCAIYITPHPSAVLHQASWYDVLRRNLIVLKKPRVVLHNLIKKTFLAMEEEIPCIPHGQSLTE